MIEIKSSKSLFDIQLDYSISLKRKKTGFAFGTYSICNDGKHVIYLDYDSFRFEWLLGELRYLIKKFKLSHFYILRSSQYEIGKYKHHAVCFDKVDGKLYDAIVRESNADMLFKNNMFYDLENSRVLRFSAKSNSSIARPYYYAKLVSKFHQRKKSLAHILFYERMFNVKWIDKINHDGNKEVDIISYQTQNIK
jgi:hypothetical protein